MSEAKQALMLLPGTLCEEHLWTHQVKPLASVTKVAGDVLEAAPESFALAGHSMGAIIAFEIMRQEPQRVVKLAILSGNAGGSTAANFEAWNHWEALTHSGHFETVLNSLTSWVHYRENPLLHAVIKLVGYRVGKEAFLKQLATLRGREDRRSTLAEITCPTLLIAGRADPATPVALHEEIAAQVPNATLKVLENCGHYSPLEQPALVTAALREWLA